VRSYDQALLPDKSVGYYFASEQAENVKRDLEEGYPQNLFSIEVFELPGNPTLRHHDQKR
jgi:hypothetical protein